MRPEACLAPPHQSGTLHRLGHVNVPFAALSTQAGNQPSMDSPQYWASLKAQLLCKGRLDRLIGPPALQDKWCTSPRAGAAVHAPVLTGLLINVQAHRPLIACQLQVELRTALCVGKLGGEAGACEADRAGVHSIYVALCAPEALAERRHAAHLQSELGSA